MRRDLAPVAVVLPPKRHLVVPDADEPMIRDGHPVGGPAQIVEHVARSTERGLCVDDPIVAIESAQPGPEGRLVGMTVEVRWQREGAGATRVDQPGDDFPAKHATEDLHGQEERWARRHPPRPVGRETARLEADALGPPARALRRARGTLGSAYRDTS
jgi:hypothetical protein